MEWYEADVQQVEQQIRQLQYNPSALFYGSSSFRLWQTLYEDFKLYCPANMGFGGSTLEACVYYFSRMMEPLSPEYLVIYAGDNDLGDGKSPEAVFGYFLQLNQQIRNRFGNIPYTFMSVKPSITRWNINNHIKYTNLLIKDAISNMPNTFFLDVYSAMLDQTGLPAKQLYDTDGLHLSSAGYRLWKGILLTHISSHINSSFHGCKLHLNNTG